MILLKRLSCGKDTLELVIQSDEEGKILKNFANPREPLIAEIVTYSDRSLPDLIIRKVKQ